MFGSKEKILAPVEGKVVPLSEVNDPTFSQEILGKGVAIIPERGRVVAPASGELTVLFQTLHAVSITTDSGVEPVICFFIPEKAANFHLLLRLNSRNILRYIQ